MTDVERLLAALSDAPGDVAGQLAVADALEESGEVDRAELTRLSAGLHAAPCGEDWRAWLEVHGRALARQRELLVAGVRPCGPEVVNSVGMRLALIPPGTFWMGSPDDEADRHDGEGPRHEVAITRPFYLGVYAVTQGQYERVMGTIPSHFQVGERHPVELGFWDDAVAFCGRLAGLPEEQAAARLYRLPTEAEWEYACRGPGASSEPFHVGRSLSSAQANFDGDYPYGGAPEGQCRMRTVPVDEFAPNGYGLHQMHGNVWEWCQDWFDGRYYARSPRRDPIGPRKGSCRVFRGGSWGNAGQYCRSAYRCLHESAYHNLHCGLRVALASSR